METVDLLTDPAGLVSEDGGCTCTAVEPNWIFISPDCAVHAHLIFEEA